MKKKPLFIITWTIIGVVLIFAASLLFLHLFGGPSVFVPGRAGTLDISDVNGRAGSLQGQQISVRGQVTPGSVNLDEKTQVVTFVLTDDRETLTVTYGGRLPSNFKPGAILEVQGKYRPGGILEANSFGRPFFCVICHG